MKKKRVPSILRRLHQGASIALVSDSGMPCFSDPGSFLVRSVRSDQLPVYVVPGANAAVSALALSGYADCQSLFLGFLSPKKGRMKKALMEHDHFKGMIVLYESVYRICRLLECVNETYGVIDVFVARELTKKFEEGSWKTVKEWLSFFSDKELKGEFTVVLNRM